MLERVITNAIVITIILIVFAWASINVEMQIQYSEFNAVIHDFQILASFDDNAFREGDTNYVVLSISRGYLDDFTLNTTLDIYVDYNLVYSTPINTLYISYRAGWLVSTTENFYRGDSNMITSSSVLFIVYTNESNGARVFIKPRVRVVVLGTYIGRKVDGSIYKIFMINIMVPTIALGQCFGSSPYRLVFQTEDVQTITLRFDYTATTTHSITISAYGESYNINTDSCDTIVITIVISKILYEVLGA